MVVYKSSEDITDELANYYLRTNDASHRYLAYRDIPKLIKQFVTGKRTLDFGAGTGSSTKLLDNLGLDVTGLDISFSMLEKARSSLPNVKFYHVDEPMPKTEYDLVFSSFVLLELSNKNEIVQYLNTAASFLRDGGIFIGITSSEQLYSASRKWKSFNSDFDENRNLKSGDITRIALKNPAMQFFDYFWKESDYLDCFQKTNLKILQVYFPLALTEEGYSWEDETSYSPFTIFIAKKIS